MPLSVWARRMWLMAEVYAMPAWMWHIKSVPHVVLP